MENIKIWLLSPFSSPWTALFIAGFLEMGWAVGLKYTEGFSKIIPSTLTVIAMILSLFLLGRATQQLPIGTAYAVWVGIGAAGASILGIFLFQESLSPLRLFFIALLIISIVGLKFTSSAL
jgi:quaternary ammonium compound-resistance protein SugE